MKNQWKIKKIKMLISFFFGYFHISSHICNMKARFLTEEQSWFLTSWNCSGDHRNNRSNIFYTYHTQAGIWCAPPKGECGFFEEIQIWGGIFWNKCQGFNFFLSPIRLNRKLEVKKYFSKACTSIWLCYLKLCGLWLISHSHKTIWMRFTLTFLAIRTLFNGFKVSFHLERATWPVGRLSLAHRWTETDVSSAKTML